jgi:ferredoxin--NADP+ reductase
LFWGKIAVPLSPEKFYQARILSREDLSENLWKIRVDPGGDFRFVAGQYATLGLGTNGDFLERPYSLASSPYEREVEFFLELVEDGGLTPLLHKLRAGDTLSFRKRAKGRFTLDLTSGRRNHLLVCTVTGIAPYVSYARTLYKDWKKGTMPADLRLFVIHGASRSWEFGYRTELEGIAAEAPWLTYIPTVSRPREDATWKGETGRADDILRKYVDLWALTGQNVTAYLCGHPKMLQNASEILARQGWDRRAIQTEAYFQAQ